MEADVVVRHPKNVDAVFSVLPHLTKSQLKDVRMRITFLLQSDNSQDEDWLLNGILTVAQERGAYKPSDKFNIKKGNSYKQYLTKSEIVKGIVLSRLNNSISPAEKLSLGFLLARLLANHISKWGEVSVYSLLENVHRIPSALQLAFPGYLESGLLHLLIRKS